MGSSPESGTANVIQVRQLPTAAVLSPVPKLSLPEAAQVPLISSLYQASYAGLNLSVFRYAKLCVTEKMKTMASLPGGDFSIKSSLHYCYEESKTPLNHCLVRELRGATHTSGTWLLLGDPWHSPSLPMVFGQGPGSLTFWLRVLFN